MGPSHCRGALPQRSPSPPSCCHSHSRRRQIQEDRRPGRPRPRSGSIGDGLHNRPHDASQADCRDDKGGPGPLRSTVGSGGQQRCRRHRPRGCNSGPPPDQESDGHREGDADTQRSAGNVVPHGHDGPEEIGPGEGKSRSPKSGAGVGRHSAHAPPAPTLRPDRSAMTTTLRTWHRPHQGGTWRQPRRAGTPMAHGPPPRKHADGDPTRLSTIRHCTYCSLIGAKSVAPPRDVALDPPSDQHNNGRDPCADREESERNR